jgi:hypothetical protein
MSLTPCAYDGRQRPVAVTCCERCERFPACLPKASPQLRAQVAGTFRAGAVEHDAIMALLATLKAALDDDVQPEG